MEKPKIKLSFKDFRVIGLDNLPLRIILRSEINKNLLEHSINAPIDGGPLQQPKYTRYPINKAVKSLPCMIKARPGLHSAKL